MNGSEGTEVTASLAQSLLKNHCGEVLIPPSALRTREEPDVKTVFEYLDFRTYLADALEERRHRGISTRAASLKAGFRSPNYLKLVTEGKRRLTQATVTQIADFLKLTGAEREFFENLVSMNQAGTPKEQDYYYEKLKSSRRYVALKHIERDQYEYFSKWYYAAIRELVLLSGFKNNPDWIARTLKPNIPIRAAREAMELLFHLELIRRGPGGRIEQTDVHIGTPPEIADAVVWSFHQEMLERSRQSLDVAGPDERDVTALTVAITREQYKKACRKLHEFRHKLHAELTESANGAEAVYQLNIQFFPLSEVRHAKKL